MRAFIYIYAVYAMLILLRIVLFINRKKKKNRALFYNIIKIAEGLSIFVRVCVYLILTFVKFSVYILIRE